VIFFLIEELNNMAKTFEKKLLSSAMAVALASGLGFSGSASAIHLAEDGVGQVLLAPYYTVLNGYSTEVTIVNTRTDVAVKAKVVLRSRAQSTEVLDFVCYLTPADVCRFTVRINASGQAEVYSTDDSLKQRSVNAFATAAAPAIYPVFDERMLSRDNADVNEWGHIEVVGAYAVAGTINTPAGAVVVRRTMTKPDLAKIFDTPRATLHAAPLNNALEVAATGRDATDAPTPAPAGNIRSADPNWVRLMGTVETVKSDRTDRYGYRIPALAGEIGDNVDVAAVAAGVAGTFIVDPKTGRGFDGRVIANPMFDVDTAVETTIGSGFSFAALDNIYEIENALIADNLYGEYDVRSNNNVSEGTGLLVTFPTRYRHRFNDVCGNLPVGANYSYPFTRAGHIQFARNQYDNMENTVLPPTDNISGGSAPGASYLYAEVNALMMAPNNEWDSFAKSGWFDIDLIETPAPAGAGTVCDYNGVPTIAFVYDWMSSSSAPAMGNVMNSMLTPASYSPELVNRGYENLYPVGNDMGQ
jgi:hypothetical protein